MGGELATVRWGLIPAWAKDPAIGNRMINARAEGITDKSAFRSRRCIVPASGCYEWRRQGTQAALLIRRRKKAPIGFAGLWESWEDRATGEVVETSSSLRAR